MDIAELRNKVKDVLEKDPDIVSVGKIDDEEYVLGVETESGDMFFITLGEA